MRSGSVAALILAWVLVFSGTAEASGPEAGLCASLLQDRNPCKEESCMQMGIKSWTEIERQDIVPLLSDFSGRYPAFFASLKAGGFGGIFRATSYGQGVQGGYFDSRYNAVFIFDWLIQNFLSRSPEQFGWIILHELAHAYDANQGYLARQDDFFSAAGWIKDAHGRMVLARLASDVDWRKIFQRRGDALLEGDFEGVTDLDRKYAHPYGFPSLYAMSKPKESFAEFAAAFRYGKDWKSYVRPEVDRYFRRIMR